MKNLSKKTLWGIIATAAVVVLIIVLVVIEQCGKGKIIIKNNTDIDIEDISISFFDEVSEMTVDWLFEDSIASGEKVKVPYDGYYDFSGMECTCDAAVKFAGYDTIYVYDGDFTGVFKGDFYFSFDIVDGEYVMTMKGYEGLFKSTKGSDLDDNYILDLPNADWE